MLDDGDSDAEEHGEDEDESVVRVEEGWSCGLVCCDRVWLSVKIVCEEEKKKAGAGEDG